MVAVMGASCEPRRANLRGFTIIEVMIVVAMLSFGLLSLSAMRWSSTTFA